MIPDVTTLTLTTPNARRGPIRRNDRILIDSPTATTSRVRESGILAGNLVFSHLTFSAATTLVVDTASNDGPTPGSDLIQVEGTGLTSLVPDASGAAFVTTLTPVAGDGTNTLILAAGSLFLNAGSTADSGQTLNVVVNGGATLTLTATQYLKSLTLNDKARPSSPPSQRPPPSARPVPTRSSSSTT